MKEMRGAWIYYLSTIIQINLGINRNTFKSKMFIVTVSPIWFKKLLEMCLYQGQNVFRSEAIEEVNKDNKRERNKERKKDRKRKREKRVKEIRKQERID